MNQFYLRLRKARAEKKMANAFKFDEIYSKSPHNLTQNSFDIFFLICKECCSFSIKYQISFVNDLKPQ